jgi:hypothetical protein
MQNPAENNQPSKIRLSGDLVEEYPPENPI